MSVLGNRASAQDRSRTNAKRPRSAVTSGRQLFVDGDPNSAWARRYADLLIGHVVDAGGRDMVSAAKLSLIRRATALECEIERLEAKLSRGEEVDLDAFGRAASHLRRIFESIGIERTQRDVTVDLRAYLASAARDGAGSVNANPEPPAGQQ
jgi:hypothetical protein